MKAFKKKFLFVLMNTLMCLFVFNISSEAISVPLGDMDGNGIVNSVDARIVLKLSLSNQNIPDEIKLLADVNEDGRLNSDDARQTLRTAVLLEKIKFCKNDNRVVFTGFSDNGYVIYSKNDITFVDGILIANKSYSLPQTYAPDGLDEECEKAFNEMKKFAQKEGLSLNMISGYRSYSYQADLYNRYVLRDGKSLADTYSARPGHSEHQTGLCLDVNSVSKSFANTSQGKWLAENCFRFGFIIRYPKGKEHITGYQYEPWHIRYVGNDLARRLTQSELCIEEYFGLSSEYEY